ncbi:Cas4-domain exonuclease [Burkholderia phage BcepGomr]|uniref:Cas4-domain exonuclease n=1 Tax=Burkholderia phage BcepGomr TaxID=437329 RepID=UPI00015034FC|nr:Cas4-domain exonuclease [Burkholderia phage BcepGomr]ABP63614.1 BcepGomrgp43 [Burkholderia phage BcepGomr]
MAQPLYIAHQTTQAINDAIKADQGAKFRGFLKEHIMDIDDAFDSEEKDDFREHMGVSTSGEECARKLWYSWRWTKPVKHEGQLLRLFNRGHLEEARFVAMLRTIGCTVYQADSNGKQFRVSHFGGHYGSAIDSVTVGVPENPTMPFLTEMKTHNEKSFRKLAGETDSKGNVVKAPQGVLKTKPEHYAQMQQYAEYFKLEWCLYMAVNKNTDEIYCEFVQFKPQVAQYWRERSGKIIFAKSAPPRLAQDPTYWKCVYCPYIDQCHFDEGPVMNCRTCANSMPTEDGKWYCKEKGIILNKADQLAGCEDWAKHHSY